jgi:hypothetical protein
LFTSFYLESCIWPDAISQSIRHRNSIKLCANFGRGATETLEMIRQSLGEEGMSSTRVFCCTLEAEAIYTPRNVGTDPPNSIVSWPLHITITNLHIIRRPVYHSEHNVSETGFCLRLNPIGILVGVRRQVPNQWIPPEDADTPVS